MLRDCPPFRKNLSFEFKNCNLFIGINGTGKSTLRTYLQSPEGKEITLNGSDCKTRGHSNPAPFLLDESRGRMRSAYDQTPNVDVNNALRSFGNFDFSDDDRINDANDEISKLFNRTISFPVIPNRGRVAAYSKNNDKIPIEQDGFGIKNASKIIEVINTLPNDSVLIIEEIAQNIHPSLIVKFLDLVIKKLETKNIQLFATTQEVISGLYFIKKMNNPNFTIYNFVDNDGILDAHPIEKDTTTSMLRDFLGDFPTQEDLDMLNELTR